MSTRRSVNKYSLAWWYILKTSLQYVLKTFWRRLEDVLKESWSRMTNTNLFVVLRTSWEDVWLKRLDLSLKMYLRTKANDVFVKANVCWETPVQVFSCIAKFCTPVLKNVCERLLLNSGTLLVQLFNQLNDCFRIQAFSVTYIKERQFSCAWNITINATLFPEIFSGTSTNTDHTHLQ